MQFAPLDGAPAERGATRPARLAAANVYYAQQQRKKDEGAFAASAAELSDYLDAEVVAPFTIELAADGAEGFNATVVGESASVRVRQTGS